MAIPLYFLPSISYLSYLQKTENIEIELFENYQKSTDRNRCAVAGANGKMTLSIPLLGGRNNHLPFQEIKICYAQNWQKKHWQSLVSAYANAPFFDYYAAGFEAIFFQKQTYLMDYNFSILEQLMTYFKINKTLRRTTCYQGISEDFILHEKDFTHPKYIQVFDSKNQNFQNLSGLDLLFNEGPAAKNYL